MEKFRNRLSNDPRYIDESLLGLQASESNPNGRFGAIPGYPIGSVFASRAACSNARVHGANYAGIHGSPIYGAYSICVSNGYEDDKDEGDVIIYTGTGGQQNSFSGSSSGRARQVADQTFNHPDNGSLMISSQTRRPVRVIRGPQSGSPYAPLEGYRYDGFYIVERAYLDKGQSGYQVCKFELRRVPGQPLLPGMTM